MPLNEDLTPNQWAYALDLLPQEDIPEYALSYEREWLAKNGGQGNG